jgi:hypothetical protein
MADYSFDTHLSGSVASDVVADVTLGGLNDIKTASTVATDSKVLSTVASESKLASDSKVHTDSTVATNSSVATTSNVDLAPVAVDSCVRVELGPLPPTQVTTPWEQRFGLSVLGVELVAWTISGRTSTRIAPFAPEPRMVGIVEQGQVVRHDHDDHRDHGHDDDGPRGLHIRLG